mmetsp:Transcript_30551/g.62169  ORF Transcript_30551/g.62169 Transcript_30551/m.62169 type:complete len:227 (-) Transcript_30551:793-1473(-)
MFFFFFFFVFFFFGGTYGRNSDTFFFLRVVAALSEGGAVLSKSAANLNATVAPVSSCKSSDAGNCCVTFPPPTTKASAPQPSPSLPSPSVKLTRLLLLGLTELPSWPPPPPLFVLPPPPPVPTALSRCADSAFLLNFFNRLSLAAAEAWALDLSLVALLRLLARTAVVALRACLYSCFRVATHTKSPSPAESEVNTVRLCSHTALPRTNGGTRIRLSCFEVSFVLA